MKIEDIAQVAHEANAAYCRAIGDNSQKPWTEAPQWQKDSAINGVKFIKNNPNATPSASHDSWLAEKRAAGWKYGLIKDEAKKEHPCFVEYDKLPTEQKAKDYIFGAVARTLIPHLERVPSAEELALAREQGNKVVASTQNVVTPDDRSLEQKAVAATTYSDDGRRTIDLSQVTAK